MFPVPFRQVLHPHHCIRSTCDLTKQLLAVKMQLLKRHYSGRWTVTNHYLLELLTLSCSASALYRHFHRNFPNSLCVVGWLSAFTARKYQLVRASLSRSIAALLCLYSLRSFVLPETHNFLPIFSRFSAAFFVLFFFSLSLAWTNNMGWWGTKQRGTI